LIDFKYDSRSGKLHLIDTNSLDSYIFSIIKNGFDLGDNTIYLRPSYIDMDGNPIKKSGTITFGSSEDVNLYRSDTDVLRTDDNFDALALRVGGTEVITSSRVLQNIAHTSTEFTLGHEGGGRHLIINDIAGAKWSLSTGSYDLTFYKHKSDTDTWEEALRLEGDGATNVPLGVTVSGFTRPKSDNTYDLGSASYRWRNLEIAGYGNLGSLKINGTEVISSSRVLKNISNIDQSLLPLTDSSYNLGSSDLKWNAVYANHFYGTAHYADIFFQDLVCPICNKHFKENDKLVLLVTKVLEKEIRCVPAHLECV